jgi:hypothetical protein
MKQEPLAKPKALFAFGAVAIVALCGISFAAGYQLKGSKTNDSSRPSQNSQAQFGGSQSGGPGTRMGNGAFGEVTAITSDSITVNESRQDVTVTLKITSETKVTNNRETASAADIKVGDQVMVQRSSEDSSVASRIIIGAGGGMQPQANDDSSGI